MNNYDLIKPALIEALETYFRAGLKEAYMMPSWGVSFILRSKRHMLPVGAFLICHTPPQASQHAWKHISTQYPNMPIFCINAKTILNPVPEIIQWEPGCHFAPIVKATPIEEATTVIEPSPEPPTQPTKQYELYLTYWEKGNVKRHYVNGKGFDAETKNKNLSTIFPTKPSTPVKVYAQNGKIFTNPTTPVTPQAEAYIMDLVNAQQK